MHRPTIISPLLEINTSKTRLSVENITLGTLVFNFEKHIKTVA
jgi:hypothetical protein